MKVTTTDREPVLTIELTQTEFNQLVLGYGCSSPENRARLGNDLELKYNSRCEHIWPTLKEYMK